MLLGDGNSYSGQFLDGQPHGEGTFEYVNKDRYTGNFIRGVKEGHGMYYFSEGTVFVGEWSND